MNFKRVLDRLREEPEWLVLGAFLVVLVLGGVGYYVYDRFRSARRASTSFHRVLAHYNRALNRGRYDDAVQNLQTFLRRHSGSRQADKAMFFLGKLHYLRGEYRPAVRQFQRVVDRHPDSFFYAAALLHLGYCERQRGRPERALEWFDRLREANLPPGDPMVTEVRWQRALALRALDRTGPARAAFERVTRGDTPSTGTYWSRYAARGSGIVR